MFKAAGIERVLIAYDRDAAGDMAADKLAKRLMAEGLDCFRLNFPKGMDANAYALQVRPAAKSLGVVIRSAVWLGQGQPKAVTTQPSGADVSVTETEPASDEPAPPTVTEPPVVPVTPEPAHPLAAKGETSEPLPAAAVPPAPRAEVDAEVSAREVVIVRGERRYRIRGLEKNLAYEVLKVNVLASRSALGGAGESVHVDSLDLYQHRAREAFVRQAAVELGVGEAAIKADLGQVLLKLEALQAERIEAASAPKVDVPTLDDAQVEDALALLRSPTLLDDISRDFARCGVVGETVNARVAYLAAVSRKLDAPLAITIQSTSAAGKSSLMDAVLAFVPAESRSKFSAMTGQSLFYMGETDLQHTVLAIVEEEGASSASYALKLLQSEGELTIASTGKDAVTGELKTHAYQVKGPVMLMLTTTAIDIDEELLNRCLVLSVDEGRAQTQAIHVRQRERRTLAGLLEKAERTQIIERHQNAQRLLKPLAVVNPYANHLSFIDDRTRTRRDHEKYLTLIDAIALLHQHQRPIKAVTRGEQTLRYVEVTLDDIAAANQLAHEVLGRTLDTLPPQTRKLLGLIVEWVRERCQALTIERTDYRFSRRDVREATGWGHTQLKVHLHRLEELEYLLVHRGGRGQSFVYELLYDGDTGTETPHLSGLIDAEALRAQHGYDANRSGSAASPSVPGRPQAGPVSGTGRSGQSAVNASDDAALCDIEPEAAENALPRPPRGNGSYRSDAALEAHGAK